MSKPFQEPKLWGWIAFDIAVAVVGMFAILLSNKDVAYPDWAEYTNVPLWLLPPIVIAAFLVTVPDKINTLFFTVLYTLSVVVAVAFLYLPLPDEASVVTPVWFLPLFTPFIMAMVFSMAVDN